MKKTLLTIAALGAALNASVATAEDVTHLLEWNESKTEANLNKVDFTNKEFSVALTLDMNMMTSVDAPIFYVMGKNADTSVSTTPTHGLGYDSYDNDICGWYNNSYDGKLATPYSLNGAQGANYATVVYTFKTEITGESYNCFFSKNITFWDTDGTQIGESILKSNNRKGSTLGTLSTLTLQSSYVTDIYFYNEVLTSENGSLEAAINQLKEGFTASEPSSPTVPEPATATLSLLALAGLAARRRRR